jgi:hypothetical protein
VISASELFNVECAAAAALAGVFVLLRLEKRLARSRPGLRLRNILLAGFVLRLAAVAVLDAAGSSGETVRGPDDSAFLQQAADAAAGHPGTPDWWKNPPSLMLAAQIRLLGHPASASLRIVQMTVALVGVALIVACVYDLAGKEAAAIAGWILACEPTMVVFSTLLHKESLVLLGEGAAAFGAMRVWLRRPGGLALLGAGCALVLVVRPYAGAVLAAGAAALVFHALLRGRGQRRTRAAAWAAALLLVCAGTGLAAQTGLLARPLDKLQTFQLSTNPEDANLALEPVNVTTLTGLARAVPIRVRDYVFRPYPWQRANLSQQMGAGATVLAWLLVLAGIVGFLLAARRSQRQTLPLLYLLVPTLLAYALTTANAGTGFRHRVHLIFFLAGVVGIVWSRGLTRGHQTSRRVRLRS